MGQSNLNFKISGLFLVMAMHVVKQYIQMTTW